MFSSGRKVELLRRIDDQRAAREALADVVVGVAFERQRDALRQERAEALSGRSVEVELDGVVRQARRAVLPRDLAAQHRAHGAVHVADRQLELDRRAVLDRFLRVVDQLVVERLDRGRDPARSCSGAPTRAGITRVVEDAGEVEAARLPVLDRVVASRACRRGRSFRRTCGSPASPCTRAPARR